MDDRNDQEQEQRRRRLAEIFGDVLPDTTSDDRPDQPQSASESERWYRENRPPHHDAR